MPRIFFHIHNGDGFTPDEEGREFRSVDAAATEALRDIRSIVSEEVKAGRADLRGRVELVDESGRLLRVVQFRDAVEIPEGRLPEEVAAG